MQEVLWAKDTDGEKILKKKTNANKSAK